MAHNHGSGGLCPTCAQESKVSEQDFGTSLYKDIDRDSIRALNEREDDMGY